jgi:predicted RNA binding protein YcfA (HicA-like mRNA interferase family)
MARLLSSAEVSGILVACGFRLVSQRGSHVKYRDLAGRTVIVPAGRRELPRGTLASIIRQSGLDKTLFD